MAESTQAKLDRTPDSALADDIKALQASFAQLAKDLQGTAVNGATERAKQFGSLVASKADQSAKLVTHQVEEHPLLSVLIAFGVGVLGGRLLSR
jgi:ElaB/YqjD/DUF883 family membrane-anchored ribosome-binding protein